MPLALLLLPYALFLLFFGVFSLFALSHIFVYGEKNFATFFATFLYIAGSAFILFFSWTLLAPIEWKEPLFVLGATLSSPF